MNIFATDYSPFISAQNLPDKHVCKMPTETAQMLACVVGELYNESLPKKDGTSYLTPKHILNHPCTQWALEDKDNLIWLVEHGIGLCKEYTFRYAKHHSAFIAIKKAIECIPDYDILNTKVPRDFVRAMPDDLKNNQNFTDIEAYRLYLNTKSWVSSNYLRIPSRKPAWIL